MSGKKQDDKSFTRVEVKERYSRALRPILWLIRFFWRVRVRGAENLPEGACLLCPNHISISDIPVLSGALSRRVLRYMAKKELFSSRIIRRVLYGFGAYPVDRANGDISAIKTAISLLRQGETLVIFPQGHRYPGVPPETTEVRGGAMLIAKRAGVPLVPVFLKTKNHRSLLFRPVEVIIGPPCDPAGFVERAQGNIVNAMKAFFARACKMGETGEWN